MNGPDLKSLLRGSSPVPDLRTGPVQVLVALNTKAPNEQALVDLRDVGLRIDSVVRNTVLGVIDAAKIVALKGMPLVAEVDLSMPLKPHRG